MNLVMCGLKKIKNKNLSSFFHPPLNLSIRLSKQETFLEEKENRSGDYFGLSCSSPGRHPRTRGNFECRLAEASKEASTQSAVAPQIVHRIKIGENIKGTYRKGGESGGRAEAPRENKQMREKQQQQQQEEQQRPSRCLFMAR